MSASYMYKPFDIATPLVPWISTKSSFVVSRITQYSR